MGSQMHWKPIREAAEEGPSLATWKRRVSSGEWPSYLEVDPAGGPGVRMVWTGPLPDANEVMLEQLREELGVRLAG